MFGERIIKIKGKSFEDLTAAEVAKMIMADSAISPNGSELFSSAALDEFLHYDVAYRPELEKIRNDILDEIYIEIPGKKEKEINVEFLKRYSENLTS